MTTSGRFLCCRLNREMHVSQGECLSGGTPTNSTDRNSVLLIGCLCVLTRSRAVIWPIGTGSCAENRMRDGGCASLARGAGEIRVAATESAATARRAVARTRPAPRTDHGIGAACWGTQAPTLNPTGPEQRTAVDVDGGLDSAVIALNSDLNAYALVPMRLLAREDANRVASFQLLWI